MIRHLLIAAAALAIVVTPAAADPGNGRGHGNGNGNGDADWNGHGHGKGHGDRGLGADTGFTPPGLAKKPLGMPPGQVRQLWNRGQYLPRAYYTGRSYYVLEPVRYHLRPPPYGYRWVRVDGRFYLVQTRTGLIAELVSSLVR